jgi:BlaI family transcriptional regulator, penicillinase repressor
LPRRKSETLTEAELRLMDVLWQKGSATVQQVLDALPEKPALAYNSVLTTIRVLETKGYLEHVKDGRAHIYKPILEREEATRSEIRHLVGRFFKNSHELLVLNILEDLSSENVISENLGSENLGSENKGLEASELKRLRALLQPRDEKTAGQAREKQKR